MNKPPYSVIAVDCVGNRLTVEDLTFPEAIDVAGRLAATYPSGAVAAFNMDGADCDFDGLSDDEREDVVEAVAVARRRTA